ncbi:MAG: hypothetical protein RBS80_11810 [Thermoguttaceae bacterium]|jgi:hypothetical protein|nr:hypothetical protein [Thermoguttaceae bacterium]
MNAPETNSGQVDDQRFDRLVDDELPAAERREFLTSLDSQPDGWRRCALAFLQAQCWRKEMASFLGEADATPAPAALAPDAESKAMHQPRRPTRRLAGRLATALAMAASFLIALWLGWLIQDAAEVAGVPTPGPEQLAQSAPAPQVPDPVNPRIPSPQQRPIAPRGPWQMVTLSANGPDGQGTETIELPACERQVLDSHWPEGLPSALPLEVLESLERSGYRVRRHRELLPIEMQDGRRLIVPVEEVDVQYVGQPPL